MRRLVAEADEVYHLAAAVGVQLIAQSPIRTIETNIYPTELLLDELGRLHAQGRAVKLFLASSSEVYGKNPKPRWTEDDDLVFGPTTRTRWSYGATKAIDEFLALAYWRERGLPVVIGRLFNVVGPRQVGAYGMVLPRLIDAALAGRPLEVHGDGRQQRCFAHVADVLGAVVALMETPAAVGRVFNIGSDQPISILDLARKVIAAVDPALGIRFQLPGGLRRGLRGLSLPRARPGPAAADDRTLAAIRPGSDHRGNHRMEARELTRRAEALRMCWRPRRFTPNHGFQESPCCCKTF